MDRINKVFFFHSVLKIIRLPSLKITLKSTAGPKKRQRQRQRQASIWHQYKTPETPKHLILTSTTCSTTAYKFPKKKKRSVSNESKTSRSISKSNRGKYSFEIKQKKKKIVDKRTSNTSQRSSSISSFAVGKARVYTIWATGVESTATLFLFSSQLYSFCFG
jgi:hypothetical protein